ncbi:tripartite tricarboxylate transporter substrate binding protein [Bacillus safensis]|uniref:tripartite tricarboxylate transporter substrate-binding protein n=1 Tax=Bacillus TaxID=1386 RepID=UPI000D035771|nr:MULTISPECIES: tripartite tricarboxylate transporter substrate-binding protein [Bacillus]MBW4850586.1 tripartite tricarboxylate transporter substrate binding protein [Bacillaceae bacterium]MBW4852860.1 tripartite tricarboxylate transporter substrate binding protein [Bacillaceae bacterium]MBW4855100.1 tripartite tricarboxylate transporter substrate binding protein [Bacillaceae bacterium]MCY7584965.1 tripartite tricarboxylate transporter substrate binding protein [Bacillus safensis]MCY7589366.
MKKAIFFVIVLCLCITLTFNEKEAGDSFLQQSSLYIVVSGVPEGGFDQTAQVMKSVLEQEKLVKRPVNILYQRGGTVDKGWTYMMEREANYISLNSSLLLSRNLLGSSNVTMNDVTPLAILAEEWQVVAVPVDSPFANGKELLHTLKKKPDSLKIGFAPDFGNDDQISFARAAEMAGIDPYRIQFLKFDSADDLFQALIDHEVDAATTTITEVRHDYEKKRLKLVATTTSERLDGFEDVPTWKEQGIPLIFSHWRGVMGPKQMSQHDIREWDQLLQKMTKTRLWKKRLKQKGWTSRYMNSKEAKIFMEDQLRQYEQLIQGEQAVE